MGHNHESGHDHHHHDGHGHGHANDQGLKGALRYLRFAPKMWRSDVNTAVIDLVAPKSGEVVVDVGAGMGAGAVPALRGGAHVVALEPTPFLRNVLSGRRWLQRRRKLLQVVHGTAEQMPVDDSSASALWAVNTMHHWNKLSEGVSEIARVLQPGGRVLLVDEDFEDPTHPDHERFSSGHEGDHHGFSMVEATQVGDLCRSAGLVDVVAEKAQLAGRPVISISANAPA